MIHQALRDYRRTLPTTVATSSRATGSCSWPARSSGSAASAPAAGSRSWSDSTTTDPLFLQVKEAEASVLEPYLGRSGFANHGQRVVQGQRLMQATSDIFLGWQTCEGVDGRPHDYYFRQLWDWKASADIDNMSSQVLDVYGQICGWTLARGHARSGDRVAIASYLGGSASFDEALARFSSLYADQNELDHAALVEGIASGQISSDGES